ncbi:hypothetical protein SAMD00019534_040800 [Acytostelium subglobosum LB1]|uniref:hypothetical protein n=1 Tax=Acytostelium subglobosum LB1 TaxID=1410327 RepID=UPI0006450C87|nr:hypothetical protein SAMD00019534_040800 [Acytostelium subglobosum LB1]GAM20905.1 hypothetical protein SAMD00019534_040800 [Acytostelium subglobosum LB1]|eukprot:XP_012756039.1 hypothetical protein SAMD00019534_040800 [Acytostelium subglobosum LB1]
MDNQLNDIESLCRRLINNRVLSTRLFNHVHDIHVRVLSLSTRKSSSTPSQSQSQSHDPEVMRWRDLKTHWISCVESLFDEVNIKFKCGPFDKYQGHEYIIKYIIKNEQFTFKLLRTLDAMSSIGRLDLVQYLHRNGAPATTNAMDHAHSLDMFLFLQQHRTEGHSRRALEFAAHNGCLPLVEHLYNTAIDKLDHKNALDRAARAGHLDVVRFLHEHNLGNEGCTSDTMDAVAGKGHLEVLDRGHGQCRIEWPLRRRQIPP